MRELEGMVVLITGASAGIGEALARQLHARGARLALAARRLEKLEALNQSLGGSHLCIRADVSDASQCEQMIEQTFGRFGRIDTLVCNAGYGLVREVARTSREELEAIFRTNVFGSVDPIRAAWPRLREQALRDGWRAQIVIVSSAAGRRGLPFFGAYAATKSAQLGLAEALRVELKPDRIAVTSVHPIGTETSFFDEAERMSNAPIRAPGRSPVNQTAQTVAKKMTRAIQRPVRELWPFWPARFALALNAILPSVGDFVMNRMRRQIVEHRKA